MLKQNKEGNRPVLEFPLKYNNRRYTHPFVGIADMKAILRTKSNQSYQPTTVAVIDTDDPYHYARGFPYIYLDSYEILNKTLLTDIKEFNENLKMEQC